VRLLSPSQKECAIAGEHRTETAEAKAEKHTALRLAYAVVSYIRICGAFVWFLYLRLVNSGAVLRKDGSFLTATRSCTCRFLCVLPNRKTAYSNSIKAACGLGIQFWQSRCRLALGISFSIYVQRQWAYFIPDLCHLVAT
jgi:hypothetical protein